MKNTPAFLKRFFLLVPALLLCGGIFAQMQTYSSLVKWSFSAKPLGDCEYELTFTAKIADHWHIYSQKVFDNGPQATVFVFDKSKDYKLNGKASEPKGKIDPTWKDVENIEVAYFEGTAVFKQKIKVLTDKKFTIKGTIEGQTCEEEGRCLSAGMGEPFPTFEFTIPAGSCTTATGATGSTGAIAPTGDTQKKDSNTAAAIPDSPVKKGDGAGAAKMAPQTYTPPQEKKSPWAAFAGGFAGGLIALLMPCVFPMIPMTVSFFTKRSKTRSQGIRNAMIYALSIVVIYVALGLLVTLLARSEQAVNQLSANIWLNLAFFAIFVIFGISFLGAFEITLPSSFVNKVDRASDRGGLLGIFFMAFTLTLVTFSCTGPIIGTALVEALKVGVKGPLFVMLGFSVALALPFALFAMFPGWLNSLPKSGGWLNAVKVIMGLIEFALAMKFISNVDLSYHWGLVTREVFIAVWIVCFALIGFYLLGKLKFSHDSDVPHVSTPRAVLAIISFTFVIYLIPGMWGAPLRALSGILPPSFYSENLATFATPAGGTNGESATKDSTNALAAGMDPTHCPLNLNCFHNYDLALAYAKKVNKPLFVDFTGYNCANCRRMEDNVWPESKVLNQLKNDYIVVSLYCDDKEELPDSLKYTTPNGYEIETWGNKWSQMQIDRYGSIAQPLYVLLDPNEQLLCDAPSPYNGDVDAYAAFLAEGVKRFKAKQK